MNVRRQENRATQFIVSVSIAVRCQIRRQEEQIEFRFSRWADQGFIGVKGNIDSVAVGRRRIRCDIDGQCHLWIRQSDLNGLNSSRWVLSWSWRLTLWYWSAVPCSSCCWKAGRLFIGRVNRMEIGLVVFFTAISDPSARERIILTTLPWIADLLSLLAKGFSFDSNTLVRTSDVSPSEFRSFILGRRILEPPVEIGDLPIFKVNIRLNEKMLRLNYRPGWPWWTTSTSLCC